MTVLGPDGRPVSSKPQQGNLLQKILADHETRLQAIAAQQIHLGIMVEFLTDKIGEFVPDFDLNEAEFMEFRTRRFKEMQEEAMEYSKAKAQAEAAAAEEGMGISLDAPEIDVLEEA